MAWYQRSYFKLIILFILLTVLQYNIILVNCINFNQAKQFTELTCNGIKFKKFNNISDFDACIAFEESFNFFLKNSVEISKVCKNLGVKNNLLYNFDKKSLIAHPMIHLFENQNLSVGLQFTHKPTDKYFSIISDKDLIGKERLQYLSYQIHVINSYNKLYIGENFLNLNKSLEVYTNFESFQTSLEHSKKTFNFFTENKKKVLEIINKAYNLK